MTIKDIEKKYKLVSVEWLDAEGECEWAEHQKIKDWAEEDCIIYEIGWVVSESKKYIVIANQITYDGIIGNKTKIPKKWVKKLDNINILPKGKKKNVRRNPKA